MRGKGVSLMITREHYLEQIRPFYDSDLIKIITGIRRCGKSVLMEQIETELRAQGKRTLTLNFEKLSTSQRISNAAILEHEVKSQLGAEKLYVFLDEVQNVPNWNLACRSLRLENTSLFITGSNSKLLSKEFTRELSGRYVSFCVRPFVWKELREYSEELGRKATITDYLTYGGFPQRLEYTDTPTVLRYLNDLDRTIVMNDLMNRYAIRKTQLFEKLVNFVLVSNARIFSAASVQKVLVGQKMTCSLNTVMKYLSYLEEAYVIRRIPQWSAKAKRHLSFYAKLYDEDVAFNTIRQTGGRPDLTHNLENVVYNELAFRGYELTVYNENGREIDFLAEKDGRQYLVQVAYSIAEETTYNREFALFNTLDQSRKKIIITADEADYTTSTVQHIPLSRFLEMDTLD